MSNLPSILLRKNWQTPIVRPTRPFLPQYQGGGEEESLGDKILDLKINSRWRERRGANYSKRDSSLDKLCNKLAEPARKRNKEVRNKHNGEENVEKMMGRTLIAFGAAHVSAVGFGSLWRMKWNVIPNKKDKLRSWFLLMVLVPFSFIYIFIYIIDI